MEWLNRLRNSIEFLEDNMESKFDINAVAKIAMCSKFHFQRMFHMTTGVTVAEYVRRRRITLAAQELTTTNSKVIDVAIKYGYATPEAFSKAFQKIHGVNPSEAKELGIKLKAYPCISFQIQVKGEKAMNYKIVEKEAFKVIGSTKRVSTANYEHLMTIQKFWDESMGNGLCEQLSILAGDLGALGICMDFNDENEEFTYAIAVEKTSEEVPSNLVEKEIPAATWAIFESIGPVTESVKEVWSRIFSEWFPSTGYEHADLPSLEVYPLGDTTDSNYKCEVWIPIIKK